MKIEIATAEDIPSLALLVNSAYRGETSKNGWTTEANLLDGLRIDEPALHEIISDPNSVMLKYVGIDDRIHGCVHLKTQKESLYLGMLTVSPFTQGNGIGKAMLRAAEEYAREHELRIITMTVLSKRLELIAWYERHGYHRTDERIPFEKIAKFGIPTEPLEFLVLEKVVG